MGKISGDTRGIHDIVQGELVHERTGLQKQGKWLVMAIVSRRSPIGEDTPSGPYLANATRGTEDD